ncbi:1-phosphatidylinositol-3-phosphate 5-kinase [Hypocenomyce scalaris]|nr:1-phosphatidylinositol-3-phosphate 5-kinase [Hypocenomyce scalaris]
MRLDPAITRALSLDPATTTVASRGGSGFSTTAKISSTLASGAQKHFFMKTGRGGDAEIMFAGEHASLNAIHAAVPSLCPASFAHGRLAENPEGAFLVTEFLDLGARSAASSSSSAEGGEESSGLSLAAKVGKLHTTPAPVPEGYSKAVFGFPVTTCCGDSAQPNGYRESWAEFYAENRLLAILTKSERTNGKDRELRDMVEKTANVVVPRLLRDGHLNGGRGVMPVVVHGDLWSGNQGRGRIGGRGGVEDVVFDPSSCYAHGEYELGIMKMFGGFGGAFMREYHEVCPKTEPVGEYEDRVSLYEL